MRSERETRYFADESDFRTSGIHGEAQTFSARKMRTPSSGGDPDISFGMDSNDAPDLGLMLSPQQAKALRDWLCRLYPDRDLEQQRAHAERGWDEGVADVATTNPYRLDNTVQNTEGEARG